MAKRTLCALAALRAVAEAQRTWARGEAVAGGASVALPPPILWPWADDPNVAAFCVVAAGARADAAAREVSCFDLATNPGTRPFVVPQLAFAAREATESGATVSASLGVQPVDAAGRGVGAAANVDVAILPPPPKPWDLQSPRVLVAYPPPARDAFEISSRAA